MLPRILKYLPLLLATCLVAAWAVSCLGMYVLFFNSLRLQRSLAIAGDHGTLVVQLNDGNNHRSGVNWNWIDDPGFSLGRRFDGGRIWPSPHLPYGSYFFEAPIPGLLIVFLPLTLGPLNGFRFRLWHYLAYTALVAVVLALYGR